MTSTPRGVVAVFTDKHGRVIASVSDFEPSGYGGCSLRQSQETRAKTQLAIEVIRGYCADPVCEVLRNYDCQQIMRDMVNKGAQVTIIPVGHEAPE